MNFSTLRLSGILLHISSLPAAAGEADQGIGDLGDGARAFVDFLQAAGQSCWQVLPIGPTGYGDSPYASYSAFAGNPDFISLDDLQRRGYLSASELPDLARTRKHAHIGAAREVKMPALRRAWQRFCSARTSAESGAFHHWAAQQGDWLDDFALFMTLKDLHGGGAWYSWPREYKLRDSAALQALRRTQGELFDFHRWLQWLFSEQWRSLRAYAAARGVQLMGDIPIFAADDSADVWAHPDQFLLDGERRPTVVAGVPPDYFSRTGQRWGNPLYDWDAMRRDNFGWWDARLRRMLECFDLLRIDHFRGFEAFWAIPAADDTAVNGRWVKAPGSELFAEIRRRHGALPLVAEDLGLITPEVVALLRECGFPGMKVLQFGFESRDPRNDFLPHNFERNCVVYTGTHDNAPTAAWHRDASNEVRDFVEQYTGMRSSTRVVRELIRAALASPAGLCLFPMQDVLAQGKSRRMNEPGQARGNWSYRIEAEDLASDVAADLRQLTALYNRLASSSA